MSDFKTRKEAETAKEASAKVQLSHHCPSTDKSCRADCECFSGGSIWEPCGAKEPVFRLTPARCGNAMFSGERE